MVQEQPHHWTTSSPPISILQYVCSCSSSKTSGPFPSLALPGLYFSVKAIPPSSCSSPRPRGIFESLAPLVRAPPQLLPQNRGAHPLCCLHEAASWILLSSCFHSCCPSLFAAVRVAFGRMMSGMKGQSAYPVTLVSRREIDLSSEPRFTYRADNRLYLILILRLIKWFFRQTPASVSSSLSTEACSPVLGSLCPASPFLGLWMSFGP